MTDLTDRQILDAMREALDEAARKFARGELDLTGAFASTRLHSNLGKEVLQVHSSQQKKGKPHG